MNFYTQILSLLTPREQRRGAFVLLLVIVMAGFEMLGVASVMPFLAVLGDPKLIESQPVLAWFYAWLDPPSPQGFLVTLGGGAFALVLFSAVFRMGTIYAMNRYVEMRRHALSERLLETYLRQPYAWFLQHHSGDMASKILSEVDQVVLQVFRPLFSAIAHGFLLLALIGVLVLVDPILALGVAAVLGSVYGAIYLVVRFTLRRIGKDRELANTERFRIASEALNAIKFVKLMGVEWLYLERFRDPSIRQSHHQATQQTISLAPKYLIEAIGFGGILLITLVLLLTGSQGGAQTLGNVLPILGVYAFAGYRMLPAAQQIYFGISALRFGAPVVQTLNSDLATGNINAKLPNEPPMPLKAQSCIVLQELSYLYPNAAKPALGNINLEISIGSSVGLVGSSGAGKTTLVDVILGLLRPTEGAIVVDGVPVTDEYLRAWQQSLGYVPQEIFLIDASVAENIALGSPRAQIDQAQVERCARMAQVHDFIVQDLPEQYETTVGERGVRLSGGQRQRIGIARALYHNPEVLVFDEATSALDTVTEQAVMNAIDALAHQKTIILIAHRLSTVKNCDQIVLLDSGKIKKKGRFDEVIGEPFRG